MIRPVVTPTTTPAAVAHLHRCTVLDVLREAGSPMSAELISKATRLTPEEVTTALRVLQRELIIESPYRGWYGFPGMAAVDATEWSHAA